MRTLAWFWVTFGLLLPSVSPALAATPERPPAAANLVAATFEAEGLRLVGDLNCTACHHPSEQQVGWLFPKTAPRLSGIGGRADAGWLMRFLSDPHSTMPGTTMPDVLQSLPASERSAAAEALVHYLVSTGSSPVRPMLPDRAAVARGEKLYHEVGCVACHNPQQPAATLASSAPLPAMSEKWTLERLRGFLRDPLVTRPSGRMPAVPLTEVEASDIAQYLLRDIKVPARMERAQFRGRIQALEDLDSAEVLRTGPASDFSLAEMRRERNFALRFNGWFEVKKAGRYTFRLIATGASRLSIADGWRLGQDSWQRERVDAVTTLRLDPGWYPLMLDYVQRGSKEPAVGVEWEGPGFALEPFPVSHLQSTRETVTDPVVFIVDTVKAEAGHALYDRLKCGACHDSKPIPTTTPSLAQLRPDRGCLADLPGSAPNTPDYQLTPARKSALRLAVSRLKPSNLPPPSPRQKLDLTLEAFRCMACHTRDGRGGVQPERDRFFTSSGEDLGEEGRLPPRLDGVGDKLRPDWLHQVLTRPAGVRPYLRTRMPQFGSGNIEFLADLFVSIDRHSRPLNASPDSPELQREAGRRLVGTDGLSCIACHRFNRQPAHALQVLDLTTSAERLNEDWFREFLVDPNRFHPGTRMPSFWPDGVSPMPAVLEGRTDRQHAAIWTYLSDGTRAKFPEGLSRQNMELTVAGETVVYRGKLWEAGFRAVAVGFPGQWNMAFDAEELRLALLWRGRFLNAGPHWGVQGMGQIRPLGSNVVVFPHGAAFAVLPDATTPWPTESARTLGIRFQGYQLDALNRPTLLYAVRGSRVQDFIRPDETIPPPGLHRTLTFTDPPPDGLHLRLAAGTLRPLGESSWRLNEALTLTVTGDSKPFLRGAGATHELLVPIRVRDGKSQLEVGYVW